MKTLPRSFIPVIVDGDVERTAMEKYGVRGFPSVKFVDARGQVHGELGRDRSPAGVISASERALKSMGGWKITKEYKKLLKAVSQLEKSVKKKDYPDALEAIRDIEAVGHKGLDLKRALTEKEKIVSLAQSRFSEAKALVESKPNKAQTLLKKVAKDFEGLEIADQAEQLAKSLEG